MYTRDITREHYTDTECTQNCLISLYIHLHTYDITDRGTRADRQSLVNTLYFRPIIVNGYENVFSVKLYFIHEFVTWRGLVVLFRILQNNLL